MCGDLAVYEAHRASVSVCSATENYFFSAAYRKKFDINVGHLCNYQQPLLFQTSAAAQFKIIGPRG